MDLGEKLTDLRSARAAAQAAMADTDHMYAREYPRRAAMDQQAAVIAGYGAAMHVKRVGGNAGAGFEARIDGGSWSKANVTDGVIINAMEVELTLSSTPTTSVEIAYHSGRLGNYPSGTITQANWRAGALFFGGKALASDPSNYDEISTLGFAVAGSNQPLVLNL